MKDLKSLGPWRRQRSGRPSDGGGKVQQAAGIESAAGGERSHVVR